ncbi:MAG: hypothetical protein M3O46_17585 [Myxococcota bacterium]|nr:hypothetical protein [Myxococcota bacterium]
MDTGQRKHNEAHFLIRSELGLFLMADGAGGPHARNVASALATTTVANVFETSATTLAERPEIDDLGLWTVARRIASAIRRANAEIIEVPRRPRNTKGWGRPSSRPRARPRVTSWTSHTLAIRCYRLRAGSLEALTVDHSLVGDILELYPDAK